MNTLLFYITKVTRWLLALIVLALVILVFSQVVLRFVFQSPLSWSGQVSRHLLVWLGFLGASVALEEKAHLAVDVLTNYFSARSERAKLAFEVISRSLILVTALFMLIYGYQLFLITSTQMSSALGYPMSYVYAVIPLSGLLMTLTTVKDFVNFFSSLKREA